MNTKTKMNMSQLKINFRGVEFDIEFDYQPEEKQTRDYPGCGAEITITYIECDGVDFSEFFLEYEDSAKLTQQLEERVWEKMAELHEEMEDY